MMVLLVRGLIKDTKLKKIMSGFAILPMTAFAVDVLIMAFGLHSGGIVSESVFAVIFVVAFILLLNFVPRTINATLRARELEAEKVILKAKLTESRIATLISQIQPHFIYNTLMSIHSLCSLDPRKAQQITMDFTNYLRKNFNL